MKTLSVINRKVAKDKDISLKTIELINDFYWKEIENKLLSLEPQTVYIKELGSITTSRYKIREKIRETILKIRAVEKKLYKPETKQKIKSDLYVMLKKLLRHRNILAEQIYVERNKDISTKSNQ